MYNTDLKLTLCRTCLQTLTQTKHFNIFNTLDLAKKLMLCSTLPVEVTDEYPQNVCVQCYEQILLYYEFQQMCHNALDRFNELLKTKEWVAEDNQKDEEQGVGEAKDPLNEDQTLLNHLEEKPSELLSNIEILYDLSIKKKRGRPQKKKTKVENLKKIAIKDESNRNVLTEDETKDSKEHLQFEYESEFKLEIENTALNEDCIDDKSGICKDRISPTNFTEKEDVISAVYKEEEKPQEEIEFKHLSDTESCSSTQESVYQKRCHQCDRCGENFSALHRLEAHKRQHDGLPPYSCTFEGCERSFNRWHFFNKHQKEHKLAPGQSYKCDLDNCERLYKNKSALNIHKRKFHNFGPELKTHMCEVCGKVFKSSAVLNDHHYTHIDKTQLPYACEEEGCTKRFSNKEKLKVHKMRHAGIKNFSCPYCGMRKTTRNELKIHINYHTLERTWPCRFCPKVCNSAGNLKMHVKNMHERAKDFACRFCERTFAKADTKKYHEMTHTGEKPHECNECGRRFVQPAALRTHRKIHLRQKEKCVETTESKDVQNTGPEETFITETIVAEILSDTNGNLD
ncbi:zinc finger protein 624 [Calliphora vicina]|uniref:zinc finger protein 624 n=1 Tax=Calliphora vicina TaxID=7373 RepID=UPI00325AFD0D